MINGVKTAAVFGEVFHLSGEADDPYFARIDENMAHLAPLYRWVERHLTRDAIIVDAGGNIGATTLLMARLVPDGHVHTFEAHPVNVQHLRRNAERNGIGNCTINAMALGRSAGVISMVGAGSSSHVGAFAPIDLRNSNADEVEMTTLDDYVATAGLPRVDFIKMDVEGFEPAVLDGAQSLIERFSPPILMEFNSWCLLHHHGFNPRDFADLLWDCFDVYTLDEAGQQQKAGGGDVTAFLHANMVLHGAVDDLLLYPKSGAHRRFGDVAAAVNVAMLAENRALRSELTAIRASTSWRITAPLRAAGRILPVARG